MKSKFLSLILAVAMILQFGTIVPVFAQTSSRVAIDFSDETATYSVSNTIDGIFDYQIAKGQYGKAKDDASIRLYSNGGSSDGINKTKTLTIPTSAVELASQGEYTHLSFQFLNEDGGSTIGVNIDTYAADGTTKRYSDNILVQSRTNTIPQRNIILPQATGKQVIDLTIGAWYQMDIYFDPTDITSTTYFLNGIKYTKDATAWGGNGNECTGRITNVNLQHVIKGAAPTFTPTAVQFDNIIVEKVSTIPLKQDYRCPGEIVNFDDKMSIAADGSYHSDFWYGQTDPGTFKRFNAVKFNSVSANTIENKVFGKYEWDNSLHTLISDSSAEGEYAMYYTPSVKDFAQNDYVHLTFAMANNSAVKRAGVTMGDAELFEMSSDGNFKFFGTDANTQWENAKWYKGDVIFKIATDTKADCYIDGVKYLSDYVVSSDAITSLGTLKFTNDIGSDYYVDDIAVGIFNQSTCANPALGWTISTDDPDLGDAINNSTRVISVPGSYKIETFLSKIKNPETVTFYNTNGFTVDSGLLASSLIKVSNSFGSGVWYTVETTGEVIETDLFDIADGSAVIVKNIDTLNIDASNEDQNVSSLDIYIDGELYDSVNTDSASISLTDLMLGKHTFEAQGWINDKDLYIDSVEIALVEEIQSDIISEGSNTFDNYTTGSYAMTGGRIVQQAYVGLGQKVVDSSGKDYGTSAVFEAQKSLDGKGHSYIDLYTDATQSITKAFIDYDIYLYNDQAGMSAAYQNIGVSGGYFGTESTFGDKSFTLETGKWYHITTMLDAKNKVASLWIDGVPIAENMAVSPTAGTISSGIRLTITYKGRTQMETNGVDSLKLLAVDNFTLSKYDELAYIKSVEDSSGNHPVDYKADVLTINMSAPVDEVTADMIKLYSTNGERPIESVTIDQNDATKLYVKTDFELSSADKYNLVIDKGLKSCGKLSSSVNGGFFETTAQPVDVLDGGFEVNNGKISFSVKLTNTTSSNKELTIIAYVYEGTEFKGLSSKTVNVIKGKNLTASVELPYYSSTARVYGIVTDSWSTLKHTTNKLYSYGS